MVTGGFLSHFPSGRPDNLDTEGSSTKGFGTLEYLTYRYR